MTAAELIEGAVAITVGVGGVVLFVFALGAMVLRPAVRWAGGPKLTLWSASVTAGLWLVLCLAVGGLGLALFGAAGLDGPHPAKLAVLPLHFVLLTLLFNRSDGVKLRTAALAAVYALLILLGLAAACGLATLGLYYFNHGTLPDLSGV